MDRSTLDQVINHVFLPPKLPQKADISKSDAALIDITLKALSIAKNIVTGYDEEQAVQRAINAVTSLQAINQHDDGSIDEHAFERCLSTLNDGDTIAAKVTAQNAAIIITNQADNLMFEAFELSARSADVIQTKGRLVRTFPAQAVAISTDVLGDGSDFVMAIAHTLAKLSCQIVADMHPVAIKSGTEHVEERDTIDPFMVCGMFMSCLRGASTKANTSVTTISKNTRDDVLWQNAELPWRRSSMWLLLRVVLQLVVTRTEGGSTSLFKRVVALIMSEVLSVAQAHDISMDMFYIMHAKIARRLHKLKSCVDLTSDPLISAVDEITTRSSYSLDRRWSEIKLRETKQLNISSLLTLRPEQDTLVSAPNLDSYLLNISSVRASVTAVDYQPTTRAVAFRPRILPELSAAAFGGNVYVAANLLGVEQWVCEHLNSWSMHQKTTIIPGQLYRLMQQYHRYASIHYNNNPEGISVMLLTIMEIWVACDKAAVQSQSLMTDYDPDIPVHVFPHLLLPFRDQMSRLSSIESYLISRKGRFPSRHLFDTGSSNSFASRYFDQSDSHQTLKLNIERQANTARAAKRAEYQRLKAQYDSLDARYNQSACDWEEVIIDDSIEPPETESRHAPRCRKCALRSQKESLTIKIHEWPLPANETRAKIVVFELDVPEWYANWRTCRRFLLHSVFKGSVVRAALRCDYRLSVNDPHLSRNYKGPPTDTITLLSENKPACGTHYASKKMSQLQDRQLCVPNGLSYNYFDVVESSYVGAIAYHTEVTEACTYQTDCRALQRFLYRPVSSPDGIEPNVIYADQEDAPTRMSTEQYRDLASIPYGCHTQWINIVLQLAAPTVDFKEIDTVMLLLQCVYQAGPSGGTEWRRSHAMLRHHDNLDWIVQNLRTALLRVKENWDSAQTMDVLSVITSRCLTLNNDSHVPCSQLLADIRAVLLSWTTTLQVKIDNADNNEDRLEFSQRILVIALICANTFNIDEQHLMNSLQSASNVALLVQMSIIIHDRSQGTIKSQYLAVLQLRVKRLLWKACKLISRVPQGIDQALSSIWSAYDRGTDWTVMSEVAGHWLACRTSILDGVANSVHLDLLTGELLVNGLPLAHPPKSYLTNPLYKVLFGSRILEVMPATKPGFDFSTKTTFAGSSLQLTLTSSNDLLVQASNGHAIFEIIPSRIFDKLFPRHFTEDYVHWINYRNSTIHFCPSAHPWDFDSVTSWTLHKSTSGRSWQLTDGKRGLVGIDTSTTQAISELLDCLAQKQDIHNFVDHTSEVLHVELPKLLHGFVMDIDAAELRSREYPSMRVATDQSIGTLFGLKNKLKLESGSEELVLIPNAKVCHALISDHTVVKIEKESATALYRYKVNHQLQRLVDQGDIGSKLYLAYLHALTASCLSDPLLRMTGTEQALTILSSAGMRSFQQLSKSDVDMLGLIQRVSPTRLYYPPNLQIMQTVTWDANLPMLAQHESLRLKAQSLLDLASDAAFFYPNRDDISVAAPTTRHTLQAREMMRVSAFRVARFGAEEHTTQEDLTYIARDVHLPDRAMNATLVTRLALFKEISEDFGVISLARLWSLLQSISTAFGDRETVDPIYDARLVTISGGVNHYLARIPSLHHALRRTHKDRTFSNAMFFAALSVSPNTDLSVLYLLALLSHIRIADGIVLPQFITTKPLAGRRFDHQAIVRVVGRRAKDFVSCPEQDLPRYERERKRDYDHRKRQTWTERSEAARQNIVMTITQQWPNRFLRTLATTPYIDTHRALQECQGLFDDWHNNDELYGYLSGLSSTAAEFQSAITTTNPTIVRLPPELKSSRPGFVSDQDLFKRKPRFSGAMKSAITQQSDLAILLEPDEAMSEDVQPGLHQTSNHQLARLIEDMEKAPSTSDYCRKYVADLRSSHTALQSQKMTFVHRPLGQSPSYEFMQRYMISCEMIVSTMYMCLVHSMEAPAIALQRHVHQWPRVSPSFLLMQLSHRRWTNLASEWRKAIIQYGVAITTFQRARRLLDSLDRPDIFEMELANKGHQNWDPIDFPETLLMEIEGNILIRDVQESIAREMREPQANRNTVLQLNMGEGKSSVIAPMTVAALADGECLVRMIVGKPQSKQMAQMLNSRFGSLVDRRVVYMPFSRSLQLTKTQVRQVKVMMETCRTEGAVLLLQPEHILSLKLMGLDCYLNNKPDIGEELMLIQSFLRQHSRDLVDESDENFSVKFELIYTHGKQRLIDASPERWYIIQQVLDLVKEVAPGLAKDYPSFVEIHHGRPGCFPRLKILDPAAGGLLVTRVATLIRESGIEALTLGRQTPAIRTAAHEFFTKRAMGDHEIAAVESSCLWTDSNRSALLLLRGLFAHGVLDHVLTQKRWRVNYGPCVRDPPTRLVVPYAAKDRPSPRTEFSHPDVAIALTCLSFYYQGLSDEDLFAAFSHLELSDSADTEYALWVKDAPDLPPASRLLQQINLKDRPYCQSFVFPALKYQKAVIDYFCSHLVFQKECKDFPFKLSTSGWDIGEAKARPTTGFSGTKDSMQVLPLDVHHVDLDEQLHTNALVLEHLLQDSNSVARMSQSVDGGDAESLLQTVLALQPPVQVILDVGAQVLELDNKDFAARWLKKHDMSKEAIIYVDDLDDIRVLDRNGRTELLHTSSFSDRTGACLVFLDECHTRGIDLKLPRTYRAAITLGPRLTKDRLVQASMRMRQLGKGQTLTFLVPREIESDLCNSKHHIMPSDVVKWSIAETHTDMQRAMALWESQGTRYVHNQELWRSCQADGMIEMTAEHAEEFLEIEALSVEQRYRPVPSSGKNVLHCPSNNEAYKDIIARVTGFDHKSVIDSTLQEEQERELSPEIERERQVQKPPRATPRKHCLHQDIVCFAESGKLMKTSEAFIPAFESLSRTSAAINFDLASLKGTGHLFVSRDFAETVEDARHGSQVDFFQKHVRWVLTNRSANNLIDHAVVISPYEANRLLPQMAESTCTTLHAFKARCNSAYPSMDKLDFYEVPRRAQRCEIPRGLAVQLSLFAGQLYTSTFEDYHELCDFLGLCPRQLSQNMTSKGWKLDMDGFILSDGFGRAGGRSGLAKSPVSFLKLFLCKIRRDGDPIAKSDLGKVMNGRLLKESDFQAVAK